MLKVSVAIPVYNSAKQLAVTLDSLAHQTMPASDFEIICVNDCSTDNSTEVIEGYCKTMPNIVLLNRTKNSGGPSAPRNNAIDIARGEYLHFIDSDDFLGEEALERLYQAAKENGSDMVFGRHIGVNGRPLSVFLFEKGNLPKADFISDRLVSSTAPHKMFRVAFLKQCGLRFDEEITAGNEDQLFVMQCYMAAKVITVMADYTYYYVVARGNENISSKIYPIDEEFRVYYLVMQFLDSFIPDKSYRIQVKSAYLEKSLHIMPLGRYVYTSRTTHEQKIAYLAGLKEFVDTCIDEELMQSVHPRFHVFLEALRKNDLERLAETELRRGMVAKKRGVSVVKARHAQIIAYMRPSLHASQRKLSIKPNQALQVYSTVPGWFEIRIADGDEGGHAEFIQKRPSGCRPNIDGSKHPAA